MKRFLTLLLACCSLVAAAQTNVLYFDTASYLAGGTNTPNLASYKWTLTLLRPNPRTYNGVFISQQPVSATTSTNGRAWFTNVIWGVYRADLSGTPSTTFTIQVETNTAGTVNAATLTSITNTPNPASSFYNKAQTDALLAGISAGAGTNYYVTGSGLATVNTNSTSSNATYTIDVPASSVTNIAQAIANTSSNAIVAQIPGTNGFIGTEDATNAAIAVLYTGTNLFYPLSSNPSNYVAWLPVFQGFDIRDPADTNRQIVHLRKDGTPNNAMYLGDKDYWDAISLQVRGTDDGNTSPRITLTLGNKIDFGENTWMFTEKILYGGTTGGGMYGLIEHDQNGSMILGNTNSGRTVTVRGGLVAGNTTLRGDITMDANTNVISGVKTITGGNEYGLTIQSGNGIIPEDLTLQAAAGTESDKGGELYLYAGSDSGGGAGKIRLIGDVVLTEATNSFAGNGSGLTNLSASGITAGGTLPALNAAALTNLNASALASGTVPMGRITTNSAMANAVMTSVTGAELVWATNLYGLGNISASGNITNSGALRTYGGITSTGLVHTLESGGTNTLVVTNGRVGIGTATPGYAAHIIGSTYTTGGATIDGQIASGSTITAAASRSFEIQGRTKLVSSANGLFSFVSNNITGGDLGSLAANWPTFTIIGATNNVGLGFSGLLTATNGVFSGFASNGIYGTNIVQPLNAVGTLMLVGDETVTLAAQSTYYQVTNFDACVTNLFTAVPSTGVLSNRYGGFYNIYAGGSGLGTTTNSQLYEMGLYTNNVECTLIEWQRSVSSTGRGSFIGFGTIYLPPACQVDVRIKSDAATPDNFTIGRLTLQVTSP